MPSTYTTNNGIELIGTGEQSGTWGDTTNTNLTLVDASLDGHTSITLTTTGTSGSPNDVPITDGATSNGRNRALIFTDGSDLGGSVYVRLTPNDAKKIMFVRNSLSGSRDLILFQGTYNASNDFVLAAGKDAIVKFDGGGSGAVASAVLADFALDAATITTISNTTLNTATVNATTVDTTNIEVTNLKAKDGTSAGSIADSTGVVTLASSVLTTTDINGGTVDGVTIGGSSAGVGTFTTANATTVDTTNIELTNLKAKDGTSAGSIANSTGVVTLASSVLTTTDINGGTVDGVTIGGSSAGVGTFTTANATTVDTTNIEVTNLKAKDGTSAGSIADSTGIVTLASSVLTTTDINGGTIDGTTIGGSTPAAVTGTTITGTTITGTTITGTTITGTGFVTTGDMTFGDNDKAIFGAGSDLSIYHDGSNSYIEEAGAGALKVTSNGTGVDFESSGGETLAQFETNGAVTLYHNNNQKLATTSTGIDVTGNAAVSGKTKVGDGADGISTADELVLSKDQANVGMSLLAADATGVVRIYLGSQTDTQAARLLHNETNDEMILQAAGALQLQSGGTNDRVTVDSSGNVGIGTTSPDRVLDARSSDQIVGTFHSTGSSATISFVNSSTTDDNDDQIGTTSGNNMFFRTNNAEAMRIDSSGNVGIGNTSPSVPLDVTGNAAVSGKAKVGTGVDGAGNGDELVLSKDQTNVGMSILAADATGICRILFGSQTSTNAAKIQHSESNSRLFIQAEGDLYFQTGGTNTTMTLNTSGDLDIDGDFTAAGAVNGTVGVGQTWQDVSGSRSANTSYQNTTGQPIQWAIHGSSGQEAQVSSNGTTWIKVATLGAPGSFETAATPVIPDNYYYRTTGAFSTWAELR
jgi:hypothetical protein